MSAEPTHAGLAHERVDIPGADVFGSRRTAPPAGFNLKAFLLFFGLWGAAGGAAIAAAAALLVAYESRDQSDLLRGRMAFLDARLSALPALEQNLQAVTAAQKKLEEANRAQQAALQATSGKVAQMETDLRLSIDVVDRKVTQIVDKSRELEAAAGLRLDMGEFGKTAFTANSPPTQVRADDIGRSLDPAEKGHGHAVFRLTQIEAGVATIDGPDGPLTVMVGDTVPGLGKVLKIGKRARYAVLVAVNQTLKAPWSQVVAAAAPSRLDVGKIDIEKKPARRVGD